MNAAQRDQAIGRRLARNGGARVLREAQLIPTSHERIARYRAERSHQSDFDTLSDAARTRKGLLYQSRLRRRPSVLATFAKAGVQPARAAAVVDSDAYSKLPRLPATGQQPSKSRKRAKRKAVAQLPDTDAPPFNDAPDPEEAPTDYADIRGR